MEGLIHGGAYFRNFTVFLSSGCVAIRAFSVEVLNITQ